MKDKLATLDLHEKPGQRVTWFRPVRHGQTEQRVDLAPSELSVFSRGPHHGHYSYTIESEDKPMPPFTMQQSTDIDIPRTTTERAAARIETDSAKRKEQPIYSGVVRYFPDALAEIARLSFEGNAKHNPGEPLHWARSKSTDQLDCLVRHLAEAGIVDTDGFYHDVKVAWRALANLQELIEKVKGLPISPGSKP